MAAAEQVEAVADHAEKDFQSERRERDHAKEADLRHAQVEGEQVIRLKTLRIVEGNPVTIHEAYFSFEKFSDFLQDDVESLSKDLLAYYESRGFKVRRGIQRLDARLAEPAVAALLEVEEDSPILYKERTLYTEEGIPVEFLYCYNRGDLYSVTFNLSAE